MAQQIQLRRGTAALWTSVNPILAVGEMGVETDTFKHKIGDGSTAWNSLGYATTVPSTHGLAGSEHSSATLAQLNAKISDATLIDTGDSRLSDARTPISHASSHTNGTDDIQDATAAQKGLATAAQITKLDGIEALADVTDSANVAAAGAVMDSDISASEGFLRKTGVGTYEAIKSNLSAIIAPTVTDDSNSGYAIGSFWLNISANEVYQCMNATVGAAVWKHLSAVADISSLTEDLSPDVNQDYVMTYDTSSLLHKKVLLNNFPWSGNIDGGSANTNYGNTNPIDGGGA